MNLLKIYKMKYFFTHVTLLFVALIFAQNNYSEIYNAQKFIDDGVALHDAENYLAAIEMYEKVAKTDPLYLKATYEKLYSMSQTDQKEELIKLFEKIYATDMMDKMPEFYVLYGVLLSNEKVFDKSEEVFKRAEKLIPNASLLNYNMAILYIRMEKSQQAIEKLKKCITYNPNHASSHYFLGLLALENGNVAHGCLALMGYLVNNPTGGFSRDAVLKLNENMGKNYLEKGKLVFSEKGDDFSELDLILRNQLSLNTKYKLNSKIDDVATRQMQAVLEYSASHELGVGFFEQIYIPTFSAIFKGNYTAGFLGYSLLSMEEQLSKSIKSEKKNIETFTKEFYQGPFWSLYAKRNLPFFGKDEEVLIWLNESKPFMYGKNNGGVKQGKYVVVNEHFITVSELNYQDDMLDGLQTYYHVNGKKSEETIYKKGVKEGLSKDYYDNGNLKAVGTYKNDLLDGLVTTYNPYGGKVCELNFINGVRQGKMECQYADGTKNSSLFYENGELNGTITYQNQLGDLIGKYDYKLGKLDGDYINYYDGKAIKLFSKYKDGVIQGERITYYENGVKKSVEEFTEGKLTKMTEFYNNKSIANIYTYDEDEKILSSKYFTTKGEQYFEENYKNGILKEAFQINDKEVKTALDFNKKPFVLKSRYGIVLSEGKIENGKLNGLWKYYFTTGQLKSEENIEKGIKTGIQKDYGKNGFLTTTYHSENGNLHGLLTRHSNGKAVGFQYYKDDMKDGPFQNLYENGVISFEGFYTEDEQNGYQIAYRQDGTQLSLREISSDYGLNYKSFLLDGSTVDYAMDFSKIDGIQKIISNNGCYIAEINYKNGYKHGSSVSRDKFGMPNSEANYVNGQLQGVYKKYHPNGAIDYIGNYYNNQVHGETLYHDLLGNLRFKTTYVFDSFHSEGIRYYKNQNKLYTYFEVNNYKDGPYTYYNIKGDAVAIINFVMDVPVSYQVLNAENKIGLPVLATKDFKIISKYNNGTTAFEMEFKDYLMDGTISVFDPSGTLNYTCSMVKDDFSGIRNEYYENGKIYKQENFVNDNFEGIQHYFANDGSKLLTAEYTEDELHGSFIIYEKNVPKITYKFNSDELYEIQQH